MTRPLSICLVTPFWAGPDIIFRAFLYLLLRGGTKYRAPIYPGGYKTPDNFILQRIPEYLQNPGFIQWPRIIDEILLAGADFDYIIRHPLEFLIPDTQIGKM